MTPPRLLPARWTAALAMGLALALLAAPMAASANGPYTFSPAVFDIAATPNGGVLVTENNTIQFIHRGDAHAVATIPLPETIGPPATVNGIAAIGTGNYFVTTGGGDLATGAALFRVARGGTRMVADITAFEVASDPDATVGPSWKDPRCEETPEFSAGPQSNPYHVAARSGGEALVADAAGNTLLSARTNGQVSLVAVFTPPVADGSASADPSDWMVLFTLPDDTPCYVQPVPTSVAIGPDGAYYVGELTGAPAPVGVSRVWRIEPGATDVTCPSASCTLAVQGLTSVIDVAFGPDGLLYVVEYDANGWLAALIGSPGGGTVKACDVGSGSCSTVASGLTLPGAITFDKQGSLWLLESNIIAPTVRMLMP